MPADRSTTAYAGLLIPDPDINADTFATDSAFTALYPRPGQPEATGETLLTLAAHDTQSSGTLDVRTQQGGIPGPQGGTFLWKNSVATDYYGWDAPTVITGWRSLVWDTTPSIAQPHVLPLQSGRILVHYAYGTGGDEVYQSGRNADGTLITPALVDLDSVGASSVSPAVIQLPTGKILLFAWIQDTAADTATLRMLHSDDDGDTWAVGSSGVLPATISTDGATGYLIMRTRAAYANGQILLIVWLRNYDTAEDYREELRQYASSDGGHSFTQIWASDRSLTGANQNGGGYPDVAVVAGSFFIAYISLIDNDPNVVRLESAYHSIADAVIDDDVTLTEAWATQNGVSPGTAFTDGDLWLCTDETGNLYLSGRTPTAGQRWVVLQSTDGAGSWAAMARSSGVGSAGKWWDAADTGTYPADTCGRWARGRIAVATCHQSNPGTYDGGSLSLLTLGGYSTATMPGYDAWRADSRQVTFGQTYLPFDEPADCGWTRTVGGAPTDAITSGLLVLAAGLGESILYHVVPGGSVAGGATISFASTVTSGTARVILRCADATEGYQLTISRTATGLAAIDGQTGATIASATVSGEVWVLAGITAGKASLWYRSAVTDPLEQSRTWTELISNEALTDDAGGTWIANRVDWGHAVQGGSSWRWLAWIDDEGASYNGVGLGSAVWPADLLGRRYSGSPTYLDADTAISAGAGPTYAGEAWTIATDYESGPDRLDPAVSPSERDGLLLDPTATHNLIWDLSGEDSLLLGRSLGVALLSTNIPAATLYGWDGSWVSVASLSAAATSGASYTRAGRMVRINSGGTLRWLERGAVAGGTIDLGGGKVRKIRANSEGQIGASTSVQAILELEGIDGTEGTSGTCTLYGPRILAYVPQAAPYRRYKLNIPSFTSHDGIARLGKFLLGSLVLMPVAPGDGREISYEPQFSTTRPLGGVRALASRGPLRRVVRLPISDEMPTSQTYQTSPSPSYVRLSSHATGVPYASHHGQAQSLPGLLAEVAGGHVVYLPRIMYTSATTAAQYVPIPSQAVYGRLQVEAATLRTIRGWDGANSTHTTELTIEEEP